MAYEFFIIGLTILIGFAAGLFFERTRISQVILLMLFGFLLGPVFGILDVSPGSVIVDLLPFIATLALIVLLFDGGMEFDIFGMAHAIPKSMMFTFTVFILSVILVSVFSMFLLGWPLLHGALLGAVVGGVSSAVVIAMVEKTSVKTETKSMLTVESTMTDALCIITAVILVQIMTAEQVPEAGIVANLLLSQFTIAILFGAVTAIMWIVIVERSAPTNYAYMLMLAVVFILFAITDAVKANGGIAVFVFGLVLGNARKLGKFAQIEWENPINRMIKLFQDEVTFFIRTFFFVYVGLLLSIEYFTFNVIAIAVGLILVLLVVRYISQKLVLPKLKDRDANIAVTMMPRGLAAAVLATVPLASGIEIGNFQEIVFGVLIFSNVVATIGIIVFDKPDEEQKESDKKKTGPKKGDKPSKKKK